MATMIEQPVIAAAPAPATALAPSAAPANAAAKVRPELSRTPKLRMNQDLPSGVFNHNLTARVVPIPDILRLPASRSAEI
jgi:hypothetical protein